MYTPTSLKLLWLWSLLLVCISNNAFANQFEDNKPIYLDCESPRYPFIVDEHVETITVCDLSIGEEYHFFVNPKSAAQDCEFQFTTLTPGQIGNGLLASEVVSSQIVFKATEDCQTFTIVNANCYVEETYEVILSLSGMSCNNDKKPVDAYGSLEKLQPIYISNSTYTPEQLITDVFIAGGCFDVFNVQPIGNTAGMGNFGEGEPSVGVTDGVILSSGNVNNANGPNSSGGTTTNFGDGSGDVDLNILATGAVNDAVGIEFDFIPSIDQISFNYAFGSEEYCEYVGAAFNDVFGFFISGPGINGPFSNNGENIALLPNSTTPVSINNVNHQTNSQYFVSNSASCAPLPPAAPDFIEYDGYTAILQATATVIPCETYHIRLVVSDVGDGAWDSAVFLQANSFVAGGDAYAEAELPGSVDNDILYEGCNGDIVFLRWGDDTTLPLDVDFIVSPSSTATAGVDYSGLPMTITIPAGQYSTTIPITAFQDFITEGMESIIIELTSSCACFNPTLEIFIDDLEPLEIVMEDQQVCGSGDVTLSPTINGGVQEYEYLWGNGSTQPTLDVFATTTGSYFLTVTDGCGNTAEESVDIVVTPTPGATISGTIIACEEVPDGQLQVDFTGEGPWEFTYTLDGTLIGPIVTSQNPYIIDINQEGTFALDAINVGICSGNVSGSVTVDWLEVAVNAVATDVLCYEIYDGTASAIADGAVAPYTYEWTGGYFGSDINGLGPGTYTVTATDAIGCTEETTITITQPTELTASAVQTQQIDCINFFGAADLTYQGGTPGYVLFWDNGSNQEDPDDLFAGPNTVQIIDNNGCTVETTVFIDEEVNPPTPFIEVPAQLSCNVTSSTLDATSSYGNGVLEFVWYDELGNIIATTATTVVNQPGLYVLEITDTSNGCQNFDNVDVIVDDNVPVAVITSPSALDCNNTSAILDGTSSTGSGSITYQWQNSGGGNIGSNPTVSVNQPGTYTLIITDAGNGCTSETTYDLAIDNNPPIAVISSTDTLGCNGGSATLLGDGSSGTGTITYEWFDNGGTSLGTNPSVEVLLAGNYTLVVTDSNNGCTATTSFAVPENTTPPTVSAEVSGDINCDTANATLTGDDNNGEYTLQWLDTAGNPIGGGSAEVDVNLPGNYTLVVTNIASGCTADAVFAVTQDVATPTAEAGPEGTITCDSGSASLSGNGSSSGSNFAYAWYNTNGVLVSTDLNTDVVQAGDYTLIVTNTTNGCTAEDMTSVVPDVNLPTVNIEIPQVINCITSAVDINGSASGTGTLSYQWTNPSGGNAGNTEDINVDVPGVYTLLVTNTDNGCSAEASVEVILDQNLPEPVATTDDIISCNNTNALLDGSQSTVEGGTATYEWYSGNTLLGTDVTIDVGAAGTYTLVVTDSENGCTLSTTVEVPESLDLPEAVAEVDDILTCTIDEVNLDASNSSATGTLNYEWFLNSNSVSTDETFAVGAVGTYTLIVTDAENGCTNTTTIVVSENLQEPTAVANVEGLLDCVNATTTLNATGSNGTGTITYEWLNASGSSIGTDPTVDVGAVGTYTLIVTNADNGCTAVETIDVDANSDFPVVDAQVVNQLSCALNTANLTGSTSSTGNFEYLWLDAGGNEIGDTEDISVMNAGTYTFVANNLDNGCSSEIELEVTADLDAPDSEAGEEAFLTCDITVVTLQGAGSGAPNLSYEWLNPAGVPIGNDPNVDVTESGTYTLVVTNTDNGCTATDITQVSPDANLPVAFAGNGGELTCLVDDFTLDGSGSSAIGTISYEWQNSNGDVLSTNEQYLTNTPGVYTLLVTDTDNGCTATATVQLTENTSEPEAIISSTDVLDCNNQNATLDGSTSTGNGILNHQWYDANGLPIGNGDIVSVDAAGVYTLEITDTENGCTASTTMEVNSVVQAPTISADSDGVLTCANEMVTIAATATGFGADFSYSWQFPIGNEIGNSPTLQVFEDGLYNLIVTDLDNGCVSETTINVSEDINLPTALTGADQNLSCDVTTVTLTGTGSSTGANFIYEWTNSAGVVVSNNINADVASAGLYTLMVTNTDNGCTATATSSAIPDSNLPTAIANVDDVLTCANNTATLNGAGSSVGANISYEWIDDNDVSLSNDLLFEVSTPGAYTLVVTNTDNGCTSTFEVEVEEDTLAPTADAGTADLLTCAVDNVTLDGSNSSSTSGVLSYQWFDSNGTSLSNTTTISVNEAGIYTLVVTSENGCTNNASVEVMLDADVPVADAGADETINCITSAFTLGGPLTSSGTNITYEWMNTIGQIVGTTATLDVVDAGTYTLVVTNTDSNCSSEQSVQVIQDNDDPIADPGFGGMLTCDVLEIELGGGNTSEGPEFTYEWTDNNNITISNDWLTTTNNPGTYSLLVTNTQNGCTATTTLTIDQNINEPTADAGAGGTLTCDVNTVALDGSGSSTGANISYEWFNAAGALVGNEVILNVSGTGDYTLLVTNIDNGCTATSMASVIPDAALPTAVAGSGGTLTCDVLSLFLNGSASSTVSGNISYEWMNASSQVVSTTADLEVTAPGVYTLLVTDPDNGCSVSDAVEVMQDIAAPVVIPGDDQVLDCGTSSLDLNGSATNGTNFSFEWFDPSGTSISNTAFATASMAGTYTLAVTNVDNGCTATATTVITPDVNVPVAFAGMDDVLTCAVDQVTLSAAGSASGAGITYQWINSTGAIIGTTETITVAEEGIYTLLVIDGSNGCNSSDEVAVTIDIADPVAEIVPIGITSINCDNSAVVLSGEQSTPVGNLAYQWSTTNGQINGNSTINTIEVGSAGNYTLTVTNLTNGCEHTISYAVEDDFDEPTAVIADPSQLTCDVVTVDLNASGSSAGANFSYSWQGNGITSGANTLTPTVDAPGTYTLIVTNEDNGCTTTNQIVVGQDIAEPTVIADVDELLDCVTETVTIDGTGTSSGAGFTYSWSGPGIISGGNTLNPDVDQPGIYTLTVENENNGCDNETTVEVLLDDSVLSGIEFFTNDPVCAGEPGSIAILESIGGQPPYSYSIDGENYDNTGFFTALDPGIYTIYVADGIGCDFEQQITIPAPQELLIEVGDIAPVIELGDEHQINAFINLPMSEIDTFYWTPTLDLSCVDCLNPIANPQYTTDYKLTVISHLGCTAEADIRLEVEKNRDVYIPTAFSPNDDDINDIFMIYAGEKNTIKQINSLQIFNRWGEVVFENTLFLPNLELEGWDGTFRGDPMDSGVFVYWAEIEFIDGFKAFYKGDVTLMK